MDVELLSAYLPMDRRHALAAGQALPDRAAGAVSITDIAGFTPLTNALATALGPRRGAEELTRLLNAVYEALVTPVHCHGGSVIGFSGDAFTSWFAGDPGLRAVACGLALQQAISSFAAVQTSNGKTYALSLKVAVAAGPVRRFAVGAPQVDVLAGGTLDRLAQAGQTAHHGEVVVGPTVARQLGADLTVAEWRAGFGVVDELLVDVSSAPWTPLPADALTAEQVRPYLLPPVYERLLAGQGEFLAELRPAVALFLRFGGLDYDGDDAAGRKLDAYVRWVQEVLGRYGGYLLQLTTGDKGSYLYAAFGALMAHEDDAARAVAAAMALRQPPTDLAFIAETRIGLSQGRVRAGAYGSRTRRTYGVQGDEVNLAARLMQAAPPGEIRCSGHVYRAAGERWIFETLPPVQVKGRTNPLPVYRPLRPRSGEKRVGGALIGRRAEVAVLTRLLADVRSGQRRVLLLEGEAGIGKSRLVDELRQPAREQGITWLEGARQSIEQGTPYRAWRDLLAAYFALDDGMSQEERQRRVRERITGVSPALAERIPLLNDVLRLDLPETDLTHSFDPQLRHESLTALVVDLVRAAVTTGPSIPRRAHAVSCGLCVVLEDAHWLDSLSWELALAVARALPSFPVGGGLLLLLALRPLEATSRPAHAALARLEGTESLRLEALSPVETVALAAARLGLAPDALPAEVADLVRERAGGNPFFAEELAYALRDSGAIVVAEGTCTLAGDLATLRERVPDTVEGVVLSRIDRLPPERQLTLKVAAVIGRSFLYRTLRDVHPRQVVADLLQAHLDDLAQRDLTLLEALEPELSYLFKHVITQQVTYDTLLFAQRRELHRAVAGWYERVYDRDLSPYYPLLVHHWNRAEDVERECHYARLAGEQAAAQFANTEAVAYLSRALDLAPERDPARRYTLLLAREQVYGLQGARRAQAQDLAALEALATQVDDDELQVAKRRAEVALRRTQYAEVTGDYPAAIASAQEAVHLAQAAQDVSSEVLGYLRWGAALWRQGEYEAAMHRGKRSLDLSRAMGLPQLEAASLCLLGSVARYQNKPSSTRAYHEQALRAYRQIGDRRGESVTLNSLGVFFAWQSDAPSARNYYEQALRVFREMGDRQNEGLQLNDLGLLYDQQGDVAQARDYLQQALRITREVDDRRGESQVLNSLGTIAAKLGNYTQAGHCLQQARHITRELGDRFEESITLYRLGDLYRRQGCYERARDCFQQALAIKRELGFWQGERWDLSELCRISYCLGQDDAAREYGRQALQIAQEIDDRHGCTYALFLSGQDLLNQGRLAEAAQAYERAIASYREQGRRAAAVESLAGLARVCLAQGELAQAQVHVEEILNSLGNPLTVHALAGFGEPFQVPLTCYRVLHANRAPRAWDVLDTAYRLVQERAAGIEDEELRRSFLENVQVHRQIITAYERAHQVIGENGQMGGTR